MEKEKGREMINHHVSMREKIVQKLSQNGCTNIISYFRMVNLVK